MFKQILLLSIIITTSLVAAQSNFISPFKLGSYYEYIWSDPTITLRYNAKIVSEELMNGLLYQRMDIYNEPPMNLHTIYFSFDTITLKLYGGEANGCPDTLGNRMAIGFNLLVGHQWNDCPLGSYFRSTLIDKQDFTGIFGTADTLRYVVRKDTLGAPIEGNTFYSYLEKFGYTGFYREYGSPLGGGPYSKELVGAIIDGVTYGSILLDVHQISNEIPLDFSLEQNYPNPFNPTTNIKFSVVKSSVVSIKVYDQLGREIATLVNEKKSPGTYQYLFNADGLSTGIYFYTLQTEKFSETRKMILLK